VNYGKVQKNLLICPVWILYAYGFTLNIFHSLQLCSQQVLNCPSETITQKKKKKKITSVCKGHLLARREVKLLLSDCQHFQVLAQSFFIKLTFTAV